MNLVKDKGPPKLADQTAKGKANLETKEKHKD